MNLKEEWTTCLLRSPVITRGNNSRLDWGPMFLGERGFMCVCIYVKGKLTQNFSELKSLPLSEKLLWFFKWPSHLLLVHYSLCMWVMLKARPPSMIPKCWTVLVFSSCNSASSTSHWSVLQLSVTSSERPSLSLYIDQERQYFPFWNVFVHICAHSYSGVTWR